MNVVGIGTEIVECLRVARMIERHGERFIDRVYTSEELRYCQSRKRSTQQFAAHWAAKEAILKALGTHLKRGIHWLDMEIVPEKGAKFGVRFRGGLADLALSQGVAEVLITTSMSRSHVVAFAMALGRGTPTE